MARINGVEEKALFKNHPCRNSCEYNIGVYGSTLVLRPYFHYFLDLIFKHANVAIWTSASSENAIPIVGHCFSGILNRENFTKSYGPIFSNPDTPIVDGSHNLSFLWSQNKCDYGTNIINPKTHKPDFKKNLNRVWSEFPGEYNSSNTIIIDDSLEKVEFNTKNSIIIKSFKVTDHTIDYTKDDELLKLGRFFKEHLFNNNDSMIIDNITAAKDITKMYRL